MTWPTALTQNFTYASGWTSSELFPRFIELFFLLIKFVEEHVDMLNKINQGQLLGLDVLFILFLIFIIFNSY